MFLLLISNNQRTFSKSFTKLFGVKFGIVVVCTDPSGKEPHREVGVGRMVTSGSLCGVMVSTLARNARDVDLISALGTIFTLLITPLKVFMVVNKLVVYIHR